MFERIENTHIGRIEKRCKTITFYGFQNDSTCDDFDNFKEILDLLCVLTYHY